MAVAGAVGGVVGWVGAAPELLVRVMSEPPTTEEPAAGSVDTTEPLGTVSEGVEPPVFTWKPAACSAAFASLTVWPDTSGTWIFWPYRYCGSGAGQEESPPYVAVFDATMSLQRQCRASAAAVLYRQLG